MAPPEDPEIIDLTGEPEYIVIEDSDDDVPASAPQSNGQPSSAPEKKPRSKRRKKKQKITMEDGEVAESAGRAPSRHASPVGKPKRKRSTDDNGGSSRTEERHAERREKKHQSESRRRERSPAQRRRSRSPVRDDGASLFFIDDKPLPVPDAVKPSDPSSSRVNANSDLLLPAHVSVLGSGTNGLAPVEIQPPSDVDSEEDDFIEFLDTDDRLAPGMVRYYEEPKEETSTTKPVKFLCKNCGAEGSHKTYQCPVQICLTCGARDEHNTRSCPISKTCYTCGMRGHINRTCPNRRTSGGQGASFDDCDRCGSGTHRTNECPTIWRIYEYLTDEEHVAVLQRREGKRELGIGNGGEGFVGGEQWCYNCGFAGHLGDDCNDAPHPGDFPLEPSGFSAYNTMSGPFADEEQAVSTKPRHRQPRSWEQEDVFPDGWGKDAPVNVGKQGKKKDRARMEKQMREAEDDPDDWFGAPANARSRGAVPTGPARGGGRQKKMSFGFSKEQRQFQAPPSLPSKPQLLDRLSDGRDPYEMQRDNWRNRDYDDGKRRGGGGRERHRDRDKNRDRGGRGDRDRDRDRDRYDSGAEPGPRYRGGYSR
ncbi:hypothetical protein PLICRDRAFT_47774 [Plicaturopsis crispa FD-325 SS-3]|nr:hypothetical protein PLICRDRAFT_47774 [Plicaturopsis crispa FD-325 SS-3]